jgi:hypothetical protein
MSEKMKMPDLLESRFNALSNAFFYEISEKIRQEVGLPVSERVFPAWQDWIKKEIKRVKLL